MTQPLALVLYEKLLPGTQLVNRLHDSGYRVVTVPGVEALVSSAEKERPMLVFADLVSSRAKVSEAIAKLKQNPTTTHLPVVAFVDEKDVASQNEARSAGANLVVNESALLPHLQHFLDQALHID
ncbi:response regulator [Pedosphaera parvula]|nr:response regulator [Pedosphaera parvula]